MDHHYIEEQNIPDRYLLGKLPAEERARFEEHFLDCQDCLARLETAENFRGALRVLAAEEAARGYARAGLLAEGLLAEGLLARIVQKARRSRAWRVALVGAVLLLLSLPAALLIRETGGRRDERAQLRASSVEWQRQYENSRQTVQRLERELRESQQLSAGQRRQLETQLERERQERQRLADELKKLRQPQTPAPIFVLSIARSAEPGQPVNRIALPRTAPRIILSLELEPDPDLLSYRATLLTPDGRRIWSASNLRPGSKDALNLSFDTSLIKPGDYLLTLEGLTRQGLYVPIAKYPFRATR